MPVSKLPVKTNCDDCKHCTPGKLRENAKRLIDGYLKQGLAGELYAQCLLRGKCEEFDREIKIERFRRGWAGGYQVIACPRFVYEALKNEQGLPESTMKALRKHEEVYPGVLTSMSTAPNSLGIFVERNKVWVSSRDVAERFEKNHKDVMRSVNSLECSSEFSQRNFALSEYMSDRGKKYPQYLMTRDGFVFLAMGFTGKKAAHFKELYIAEFNRMEEELYRQKYVPQNTGFAPLTQREAKALGTASAARRREIAMKRRLDKALSALASSQRE